jgi:hypothetical protein
MQFGTSNAPVDIEGYINDVIRDSIYSHLLANLDDALFYSNSAEKHIKHVKLTNAMSIRGWTITESREMQVPYRGGYASELNYINNRDFHALGSCLEPYGTVYGR